MKYFLPVNKIESVVYWHIFHNTKLLMKKNFHLYTVVLIVFFSWICFFIEFMVISRVFRYFTIGRNWSRFVFSSMALKIFYYSQIVYLIVFVAYMVSNLSSAFCNACFACFLHFISKTLLLHFDYFWENLYLLILFWYKYYVLKMCFLLKNFLNILC